MAVAVSEPPVRPQAAAIAEIRILQTTDGYVEGAGHLCHVYDLQAIDILDESALHLPRKGRAVPNDIHPQRRPGRQAPNECDTEDRKDAPVNECPGAQDVAEDFLPPPMLFHRVLGGVTDQPFGV